MVVITFYILHLGHRNWIQRTQNWFIYQVNVSVDEVMMYNSLLLWTSPQKLQLVSWISIIANNFRTISYFSGPDWKLTFFFSGHIKTRTIHLKSTDWVVIFNNKDKTKSYISSIQSQKDQLYCRKLDQNAQ